MTVVAVWGPNHYHLGQLVDFGHPLGRHVLFERASYEDWLKYKRSIGEWGELTSDQVLGTEFYRVVPA